MDTEMEISPTDNDVLPIDYLLINHKLRLFGAVLVLLEKVKSETEPTAAVGYKNGRGVLIYNEKYMAGLSYKDRVFVLLHEAAHLITSTMSRRGIKDKLFWNLATDIVINELISRSFGLKIPQDIWSHSGLIEMGFGHKVNEAFFNNRAAEEIYGFMISQIVKADIDNKNMVSLTLKSGKTFKFRLIGGLRDAEDMDPMMKEKIGNIMKEYAEAGTLSGEFLKTLASAVGKYFPFKEILKKHFEKKDFDFSRKNRRLKAEGTFFPRRKSEAFKVYAAVDVSGSCYDFTEDFLGYIMALPEFEEVVFFDTKIVKTIRKGEKPPRAVEGYGGTDMNPVIKRWKNVEKANRGYKLNFVCLTDGYVQELKGMTKESPLVLTCGIEVAGCRNIKIK